MIEKSKLNDNENFDSVNEAKKLVLVKLNIFWKSLNVFHFIIFNNNETLML